MGLMENTVDPSKQKLGKLLDAPVDVVLTDLRQSLILLEVALIGAIAGCVKQRYTGALCQTGVGCALWKMTGSKVQFDSSDKNSSCFERKSVLVPKFI